MTPEDQAKVDALKKLIGATTYTDEQLLAILTSLDDSLNGAAAQIWTEKMATTSTLIDVKEGSSTRNLSDLHKNASSMAAYFKKLADTEDGGSATGRPRTRAIVRPS